MGEVGSLFLSTPDAANGHTMELADAATQIGTITHVAAGDTNDSANESCCTYYSNLVNFASVYNNAAGLDAKDVEEIDQQISELDSRFALHLQEDSLTTNQ